MALSLVEIIRPVYPELLIFSAMIFETCFVITDVRCLLLADLKLGQMVSLVPRLCKNSVFAVSEYYPQSGNHCLDQKVISSFHTACARSRR
ncbi:hypothetical protein DMP75_14180 [Klebsiella michiganensis]|nr:hypothetical protein DMP75_14180 [Klebsiella michiganensis]